MKLILAITLCLTLISCGGSSSGGGDKKPDYIVCGENKAACVPDLYQVRKASSLRFINKNQAVETIKAAESKLSVVKIGQEFLKVDKCIVKMNDTVEEFALRLYTIISYDNDENYRELKAHVKVLSKPETDYCLNSSELKNDEYVSVMYLPFADDVENMLDFDLYKRGNIDGNPAVVGTRSKTEDGFETNVEYGLNLNMPYFMASYLEVTSKSNLVEVTMQNFYKPGPVVDTSGIDTTGLEEVYE